MAIWKKQAGKFIKKPWGYVHEIQSPFSMGAKIINLKAEERTSLKYYKNCNQLIILYEGKALVEAPGEKEFQDFTENGRNYFELNPGNCLLIQAASPYRISALEDSVLIEVLGGRRSSNDDTVMLEDDYGRATINKNIAGE